MEQAAQLQRISSPRNPRLHRGLRREAYYAVTSFSERIQFTDRKPRSDITNIGWAGGKLKAEEGDATADNRAQKASTLGLEAYRVHPQLDHTINQLIFHEE